MRRATFLLLSFIILAGPALAQARKEPLVDQVKKSIDKGVHYLKQTQQQQSGGWYVNQEGSPLPSTEFQAGASALAVLALLNCGVSAEDPAVRNGLGYLRKLEISSTYVRALQTLVFVEANKVEDKQRIQDNVDWLVKSRVINEDGALVGWSYYGNKSGFTDNSNSQYALLGLWAGRQGGARISPEIWKQIRDYYVRTQLDDGSWYYSDRPKKESSLTMTSAGVCGLLIASLELNIGRERIGPGGVAENCGRYEESPAIAKGLSWVSEGLTFDLPSRAFYNIYGIERVGRLSGLRFLGKHDWYREGCQFLVERQLADGSWSMRRGFDNWPTVSTSFALLFLSKGRTPVLISKVVHMDRARPDNDWNNDRNDLANLVDYASKNLFNKLPLGWQNFDMMRAALMRGGAASLTDDEMLEVTSDLLQSPIAYFNGHKSPQFRFTAVEKELLKRYVDNGGFLFVEACCGSPDFDRGFKALAEELWPDNALEPLDANHPVWHAHSLVKPGDPYSLMGISLGCKTVLVYSPQDLSCQWESNKQDNGRAIAAFKLGANVIAYATGMEPPRPKLTHVDLASTSDDRKVPRGYLKVAQLRHQGDWQPAPKAMRNLMDHLHREAGLDVSLKIETLPVATKSVVDYKFLYMHGRAEFAFPAEQLKYLRFNLESGGLLFADACCGKPAFDKSFRQFVKVLFPDRRLEEVPLDDPLYSRELNHGVKLDEQTIRCRREPGGPMRNVPPLLEGIKIDNRWVLLYSKYDIGCALERHKSSDCLGYDSDPVTKSAFRIAGAAVLYLLDLQH